MSYSLIFVSRQQTLHYVRFLKILCHCFVPTCACLCDVLKFNCLSSMPTGSQCQKCKKHSKQAETAFHARFILSHLFKAVRDRQCKYLSTYVSGFLTAVAVFRKPKAIPLFLHWFGSKFLVVMAAWTPYIHVFLGRPLFLLSRGIQFIFNKHQNFKKIKNYVMTSNIISILWHIRKKNGTFWFGKF